MTRLLAFVWLLAAACKHDEDIEQRKLAARKKMETKVEAVIAELKADCDSTTVRMARARADSILKKRATKRTK